MIVITSKKFSPALCKRNKEHLFVFGDNTKRVGDAGQACIRHEPNSKGIATKFSPGGNDEDFFSDDLFEKKVKGIIDRDIALIEKYLYLPDFVKVYHTVVFPEMMFGTGLSEMPKRAPNTFWYLERKLTTLMIKYGVQPEDDLV